MIKKLYLRLTTFAMDSVTPLLFNIIYRQKQYWPQGWSWNCVLLSLSNVCKALVSVSREPMSKRKNVMLGKRTLWLNCFLNNKYFMLIAHTVYPYLNNAWRKWQNIFYVSRYTAEINNFMRMQRNTYLIFNQFWMIYPFCTRCDINQLYFSGLDIQNAGTH